MLHNQNVLIIKHGGGIIMDLSDNTWKLEHFLPDIEPDSKRISVERFNHLYGV